MSTTAESGAKVMELAPYLFFYGRCEEALAFYKTVLGGSYEVQRNTALPAEYEVPAEWRNKVMHATFTAPGLTFMAADGREAKSVDPEAGNISLSLSTPDRAAGERLFAALSDGGKVTMPLDDAFWGGRFAIVQDRFGIEWMLSTP
ncbi:MAG: VOC family protein [Vulcanimicrobiaceae bacterium]